MRWPGRGERRDEEEADRPAAENEDLHRTVGAVALELAGVDAVQHAGERLRQRGALEGEARGNADGRSAPRSARGTSRYSAKAPFR